MKKEVSKTRIIAYSFVLLVVIVFALILGAAIPILFWTFTLLAGIGILIANYFYRRSESWKYYIKELAIFNLLFAVFIFAVYFFTFGLASGLSRSAVSVGLPIIIGILITVIFTIFLIWKRKTNLGRHGLNVSLGTYIYTAFILLLFSHILFVTPQDNPAGTINTVEDKIIQVSLEEFFGDRLGCSVIAPETSLNDGEQLENRIISSSKYFLNNGYYSFGLNAAPIRIKETAFQELVNRFIEINRYSWTLEIPSDPESGYYIDYDKRFTGGFDYPQQIWRLTHPANGPLVKISLPAYDKETGLVILYIDEGRKSLYILGYHNTAIVVLMQSEI